MQLTLSTCSGAACGATAPDAAGAGRCPRPAPFTIERLGGREIDNELELGRLHDREVGGLLAF